MDHSAMIFYHRHPGIQELRKLEEDGKISLYHAITVDRELEELTDSEEEVYEKLREMIFGREQKHLNLTEHGDLVLLVKHMKSNRDFFLTLDEEKYDNVRSHRSLKVRFPDEVFIQEVRDLVKK